MEQCEWISGASLPLKEGRLESIHVVWFHVCGILEIAISWEQKKDQWLPGLGGWRESLTAKSHGGILLRWWNCSISWSWWRLYDDTFVKIQRTVNFTASYLYLNFLLMGKKSPIPRALPWLLPGPASWFLRFCRYAVSFLPWAPCVPTGLGWARPWGNPSAAFSCGRRARPPRT